MQRVAIIMNSALTSIIFRACFSEFAAYNLQFLLWDNVKCVATSKHGFLQLIQTITAIFHLICDENFFFFFNKNKSQYVSWTFYLPREEGDTNCL